MALEVFTSQDRAEAELRGMESLASGIDYPREAHKHPGRSTEGETLSDRVTEILPDDLVEMLDDSGILYVLIDPPPVDEPIPEGLRVELAPVFAEGMGRCRGR